jgi:hemerythrin-like metal-binding protein
MTEPTWGDAQLLSVPQIDREHRELIALANEFSKALEAEAPGADLEARLAQLIASFRDHCASEERLMRASGFPGLASHAEEHARLIAQMTGLRDDLSAGAIGLCHAVGQFVRLWTEMHIAGPDAQFAGFLKGKAPGCDHGLHAISQ